MGGVCPKQYLMLQGKTVLQHTLTRLASLPLAGIVVCVAENDPYWATLTLDFAVPILQVPGGAERCHSVLNGLNALALRANSRDWVLVHDAARPCVRVADMQKLMRELAEHPVGGLLAMPVRDTMKRASPGDTTVCDTVNRTDLWHALTPQMFRLGALTHALQAQLRQGETVTDDAQAMERQGAHPVLIESHADNIKITHPQDLYLADLFLTQQLTNPSPQPQ
jgi:2-C-methyl-D-erythritol 4-phosphate cytidylyltransferase